jgi:hypothetical protein
MVNDGESALLASGVKRNVPVDTAPLVSAKLNVLSPMVQIVPIKAATSLIAQGAA